MMRVYRVALPCLLSFCMIAGMARAENVVIDLHAQVLLDHAHVVLGDVASVSADSPELARELEKQALGRAPLAGYVERRSRAELDIAIRGLALAQDQHIEWRGASSVLLRTESQLLDGARLAETARSYLWGILAPSYAKLDVTLAGPPSEVIAPAGVVEYRARMVDPAHVRGRMPVWVDVLVQGTVYRSVVVTLNVSASQNVYVARRVLEQGSVTTEDDYAVRLEEVTGLQEAAVVPGKLGAGRLRQGVGDGQILTQKQLVPSGMVLRGDRLRLVTAGGGIAIETSAYAQADAGLGQMVSVLPEHGREAVMVRVIAPGMVSFDGR